MQGVRVLEGRKVFELLFATGSKKTEVQKLLRRHPTAFFVAFGDDVTDERVFAAVNRSGAFRSELATKSNPRARRFSCSTWARYMRC